MRFRGFEKVLLLLSFLAAAASLTIAALDPSRGSQALKDLLLFTSAASISWVIARVSGREQYQEQLGLFGQQAAERILLLTNQLREISIKLQCLKPSPGATVEAHSIGEQLEHISVWSEASLRDWEAQLGRRIPLRDQLVRQQLESTAVEIKKLRNAISVSAQHEVKDLLPALDRELEKINDTIRTTEGKAPPTFENATIQCPDCGFSQTALLGSSLGDTRHHRCTNCSSVFLIHRARTGFLTRSTHTPRTPTPTNLGILFCPKCQRKVSTLKDNTAFPCIRYCYDCGVRLTVDSPDCLAEPTIEPATPSPAKVVQTGSQWRIVCSNCGGYNVLRIANISQLQNHPRLYGTCPICHLWLL